MNSGDARAITSFLHTPVFVFCSRTIFWRPLPSAPIAGTLLCRTGLLSLLIALRVRKSDLVNYRLGDTGNACTFDAYPTGSSTGHQLHQFGLRLEVSGR